MRLGIDIGGTKAAIALINEREEVTVRRRIAVRAERGCRAIAFEVAEAAEDMLARRGLAMEDIRFVGIGIPGTVEAGTVIHAPNLNWINEPFAAYFEEAGGKRPMLVQDTRAAAWCEARSRKDRRCVACVTLGTGIGCGIVIDGHVWHGAMGTAGEIGHIPTVPGGRDCACGRKGCMEAYASGTGIARSAKEQRLAESSEEVFTLAGQGNEKARVILSQAVECAAAGISAMINILSPDAVIFSGGLSGQRALYMEPLMAKIRAMAYPQAVGNGLCMEISAFGEDAPMIGAAFMDEA